MRKIDEIIIHTLATPKGWMAGKTDEQKLAEVRRWHVRERGWNDIGYHFVVFRDGRVLEGRPVKKAGAHVRGRNAKSIGIALEGGKGHKRNEPFRSVYTAKQERALVSLIGKLQKRFGDVAISGHNAYANKECPAFDWILWFDDLALQLPPEPPRPDMAEVTLADIGEPVTAIGSDMRVGVVAGLLAGLATVGGVVWGLVNGWIEGIF